MSKSFATSPRPDPSFDLARFAEAQAGSYSQAVRELRAGRKLSHWMWFVFPHRGRNLLRHW
jgi:uncharacterized protein (DUF1810 family)